MNDYSRSSHRATSKLWTHPHSYYNRFLWNVVASRSSQPLRYRHRFTSLHISRVVAFFAFGFHFSPWMLVNVIGIPFSFIDAISVTGSSVFCTGARSPRLIPLASLWM